MALEPGTAPAIAEAIRLLTGITPAYGPSQRTAGAHVARFEIDGNQFACTSDSPEAALWGLLQIAARPEMTAAAGKCVAEIRPM